MCYGPLSARLTSCVPSAPIKRALVALAADEGACVKQNCRCGSLIPAIPAYRFAPRADIRPMRAFMCTRPTARPKISLLKSRRFAHAGCRAVRTARSWRGILPSTHLAREGRMTVTIGRRELLAALGSAAAAWPLGTALALNMGDIHHSVEPWRCETPL